MTTQEPDWKALCVAYVKAEAECHACFGHPNLYERVRDELEYALAAMRAAVKAHGDA